MVQELDVQSEVTYQNTGPEGVWITEMFRYVTEVAKNVKHMSIHVYYCTC